MNNEEILFAFADRISSHMQPIHFRDTNTFDFMLKLK